VTTTTTPQTQQPAPAAGVGFWRDETKEPWRRNLALVGVLVVLFIIGAVLRPELYGDPAWVGNNMMVILQQASAIGVVTVGMTFIIIGGGIDLSVGALIALAGVWCTTVATQSFGSAGMIFTDAPASPRARRRMVKEAFCFRS